MRGKNQFLPGEVSNSREEEKSAEVIVAKAMTPRGTVKAGSERRTEGPRYMAIEVTRQTSLNGAWNPKKQEHHQTGAVQPQGGDGVVPVSWSAKLQKESYA
jgi:hypothetical protein